ncbi:histone-lysine N-methyltransferase NSD2-like [Ruditapes philippinarum]|uniref:histone-lysine N-methyltransferase NSD2-like n=1 Tax=Ruditapes philippinarum TaxID=129788 RepID=UPI00295BCAD8|nr:histone-lysine N-methyltransferase NSD2-like [Ruditapes philippinarum]
MGIRQLFKEKKDKNSLRKFKWPRKREKPFRKEGKGKKGLKTELVDENNNNLEDNGNRSDANEEEIVVDDIQDEPVEERAQDENETTPVGSEVDAEETHSKCIIPPVKKKKVSKVNKNPKLEPKQLPFEKAKEVSMVEKVIQIKKQKLDSHKLPAKKRKLYDGVKKHGADNAGKKALQEAGKKKKPEKKISKKQKMQERELEINGTWVQCCNSTCMKWRYLSDVSDPTIVPERWTCSMNTNKNYNSCEKAEENYDESEHIYTKFAEGSVVWARMTGYPWWPAMVEIDPDTETFFSIDSDDSMIPTHYHVVFFDEHVSRTWVKADYLKMFTGNEDDDGIVYQISKKGQSYKKEIGVAKKNAMRARSCTVQERIELFGFASRYKGPWSSKSKGNKVEKRKSSKTVSGQESKVEQVNFLDEDTMDDVLEHTDALLDNVEEMLESINSQLDDSDADSDFMPEELIVVETKKKRGKKSTVSSEKSSKKKVNFMEADIEADMGTDTNGIECDKDVSKTERNSEIKADKSETLSKTVDISLKLDSDIFTMEMYTQNDDITKTVGDKVEEITNETKDNKTNERVQESVPKVKGKSTKRKKAENSDCNQERMKAKKQKENKSELVALLTETDSEEKLKNGNNSSKQNENLEEVTDTEKTKLSNDSTEKNLSNKSDKIEQDKTELGTGPDDIKSNTDSYVKNEVTEKVYQKEQNSNPEENMIVRNGGKTQGNTVDRSPIIREPGNEKEVQNIVGLDDEIDLNDIESDAVPDMDREEINAGSTRSTEQNLDNESDSEFDLEEHYMYDTVTDGSDKVRERAVVNVPAHVAEVDEDSDPFDLMEE